MKTQLTIPQQLKSIDAQIREKHGDKPTYQQFFENYLEIFRQQHPNSTAPKNDLIAMFYDDFINAGQIIGY